MSKLDRLQRLDLLGIQPPQPASPLGRVKLDEDESPWDWPAELKRELLAALEQRPWNRTVGGLVDLQRALSEPLGLTHEWIALGAGTGELLRHLMMAWCLRSTVVYPVPTHPSYGLIAQSLGIKHVGVMLKADFSLPVEQIVGTAELQEASMVLVGNPNNPTGNMFSRDELLTIVRECNALVVVDESFIEYSGLSLTDAVAEHENLAIVRTFSHAGASALHPLAYVLAHPRVVTELEKLRPPQTLGGAGVLAAQLVLAHPASFAAHAEQVVREREALRQALTRVRAVISWPSAANFLLVGTTLSGVELASRLIDLGIAVRPMERSPLMNCIRVTVGTPEENAAFVEAMTSLFGPADTPPGF